MTPILLFIGACLFGIMVGIIYIAVTVRDECQSSKREGSEE